MPPRITWKQTHNTSRERYDSDCGSFRIIKADNGNWRLINFLLDDDDEGNPSFTDFTELALAQRGAEWPKA